MPPPPVGFDGAGWRRWRSAAMVVEEVEWSRMKSLRDGQRPKRKGGCAKQNRDGPESRAERHRQPLGILGENRFSMICGARAASGGAAVHRQQPPRTQRNTKDF